MHAVQVIASSTIATYKAEVKLLGCISRKFTWLAALALVQKKLKSAQKCLTATVESCSVASIFSNVGHNFVRISCIGSQVFPWISLCFRSV